MNHMQYMRIRSDIDNMEFIASRTRKAVSTSLAIIEVGHSFPPNGKFASHSTSACQLHYVAAGEGSFRGEKLCAGMGFLVLPGEAQNMQVTCDGFEQFWINFTGTEAAALLTGCGLQYRSHVFDYAKNPAGADFIHNLFLEVFRAPHDTPVPQHTQPYLIGLLLELLSIHRISGNPPKSPAERYVQTVCAYIREHYPEALTADRLAAEVGLSSKYLSRIFHRITGTTPIGYLTQVRMDAAAQLLLHSEKSIGEIAAAVGYENPLYFSKVFHAANGMPPREWRSSQFGKSGTFLS